MIGFAEGYAKNESFSENYDYDSENSRRKNTYKTDYKFSMASGFGQRYIDSVKELQKMATNLPEKLKQRVNKLVGGIASVKEQADQSLRYSMNDKIPAEETLVNFLEPKK